MYVTLGVIFLLMFWAFSSLGQKNSEYDRLQKQLQLREEMHRRILDKFFNGTGSDEDLFGDMHEAFEEAFGNSFAPRTSNFSAEWTETKEGRTLVITPKTPDQQLDINVQNGMVTIKGKTEEKTDTGMSSMSFNNSFSVPGDCDASKVKMDQKNGKILVQFPFYSAKAVQVPKNNRRPLPPSEGDVEI